MLSTMTVLNLNDSGDGSLRQAIADANAAPGADTIVFAPEVAGTISLTSGQLEITDELTINGPGQDELTVSGSELSRVFNIAETDVAIDHLTVADGFGTDGDLNNPGNWGTGGGAGVRLSGGSLSLEHVVMENNRVVDAVFGGGGAIRSLGGELHLDHVVLRNNEAVGLFFAGGGAISNEGGTLDARHSLFQGNLAANHDFSGFTVSGGAILNTGQASISHTLFIGNEADGVNGSGSGGAINSAFGATLDVDHSQFIGNSVHGAVAAGGAINQFGSTATINDSRFVGNWADGDSAHGGALANTAGATMTTDGCVVAANRATGTSALGGGIYNDDGSSVTLTRTPVAANRAIGDEGIGGGVYNAGAFDIDDMSSIHGNKASTSHDDVFGSLTLLDDLLAPI